MRKFEFLKESGITYLNSLEKYEEMLNSPRLAFDANNKEAIKSLEFTEHDPQEVYFLYSVSDMPSNFIICGTIFLGLKLTHLILYLLRNKHPILRKCYKFIRRQSRWWVLLVSIIQMKINDVIFSSSVQFLSIGAHCWQDKINFAVMCFVLFILVFYCLGFYSMIYALATKKSSKCLIVYLNEK